MFSDLHISVGRKAKGQPEVLYIGLDAAAAEKAYRDAGKEFETVSNFCYPQPTMTRYPAQESVDIELAAGKGKAADEAAKAKTDAQVQALKDQAAKLNEQAENLLNPKADIKKKK